MIPSNLVGRCLKCLDTSVYYTVLFCIRFHPTFPCTHCAMWQSRHSPPLHCRAPGVSQAQLSFFCQRSEQINTCRSSSKHVLSLSLSTVTHSICRPMTTSNWLSLPHYIYVKILSAQILQVFLPTLTSYCVGLFIIAQCVQVWCFDPLYHGPTRCSWVARWFTTILCFAVVSHPIHSAPHVARCCVVRCGEVRATAHCGSGGSVTWGRSPGPGKIWGTPLWPSLPCMGRWGTPLTLIIRGPGKSLRQGLVVEGGRGEGLWSLCHACQGPCWNKCDKLEFLISSLNEKQFTVVTDFEFCLICLSTIVINQNIKEV